MSEFVTLSVDDQVARVTLDRPSLHNVFNEKVMAELIDSFAKLGRMDSVRVVVLASTGKTFCAGADIHWMKRMVDFSFDDNVSDATVLAKMLRTIRDCSKPVIARIHGATIGGGVGLIAACDLAVAVESAFFSLSEVKLGIVPAVISPFVIEKIGPGAARRYALTAERFSAAEAHRIGLIHRVLPDREAMMQAAQEIAEEIKLCAPLAVQAVRRLAYTSFAKTGRDLNELSQSLKKRVSGSEDAREGPRAFAEKRKPVWKMR